MFCPLCKNNHFREIVTINKKDLNEKYKKFTTEDFSYLITEDITYFECLNCKIRFFNPIITGDEAFYKSLQKFEWYYLNEKTEYSFAAKYINQKDRVLEVGCGKGAFVKYIPNNYYEGLEFSKSAKNIAKKNNINIKNQSVEEYAKKNINSFDVVVSFQVLEHVPNPQEFLKAKIDLLKKGGKLIISVPAEDSYLKYITNGLLNMPPHHVTRWTNKSLEFIAKQYNLKIINIENEKLQPIHKIHYLQTLIRNSLTQSKLIDNTNIINNDFINSLARTLSKGLMKEMLPNGHTVTAIYEK